VVKKNEGGGLRTGQTCSLPGTDGGRWKWGSAFYHPRVMVSSKLVGCSASPPMVPFGTLGGAGSWETAQGWA